LVTAAIDHQRQRLHVTAAELAALSLLAGPNPAAVEADAAWQLLAHLISGAERRLPGWVAELGGVIAAPALHLVVERFAAEAPDVHQIWATPARAAVGAIADDDRIVVHPLETVMIPYELARIVGLGPRPRPATTDPIVVAASVLEAAEGAAADLKRCRRLLTDAGAEQDEAAIVAALMAGRRLSWRVTSMWASSPTYVVSSTLLVVDGGEGGLWISEVDGEDETPSVTLQPSRPSEVWEELLRLLPRSQAS
jgi:hypothetical protein